MVEDKRKIIVLDTSVILYDKTSIENFKGCDIILPLVVLEELDHFKEKSNTLGENARYVNRFLDRLRNNGKLNEGVKLESNDSTITIRLRKPDSIDYFPLNSFPLDQHDNDNKIILDALQIKKENNEKRVIVVSKDVNLRIKCDALGLDSEDYYNDYIDVPNDNWTGVVHEQIEDNLIDELYKNKELEFVSPDLAPWTFSVLKSNTQEKSALAVWNKKACKYTLIGDTIGKKHGFDISAKNKEQKFALWALSNDNIPLVTLTGLAGSGKTFLSLMTGISLVQAGKFERIIITRNIQPVGKEIGFLPGDADDKMMPWMGPIIDNLRNHFKDKNAFDMLKANGQLEIAPMSFIRGRTFTNSFIILDEAQNATIHELKTVITRVGEGSKIVLMGDTDQIDTPYINKDTNGLSLVTKKLKSSHHTAHIHLPTGIRSTIASEASFLL